MNPAVSCRMLLIADESCCLNKMLNLQEVHQAVIKVSPYTRTTHSTVMCCCFEWLLVIPAPLQASSKPAGDPSTITGKQ